MLFITFEGTEGSGKSTQARLLHARMEQEEIPSILTREPGGTPLGDAIRAIFTDPAHDDACPLTDAFLMCAARSQHVEQVIKPNLEHSHIICDRFTDSTIAYQGYGSGIPVKKLRQITAIAAEGLKPDLTFLLDIPVEDGLQRRYTAHQLHGDEWNRMDQQALEYHERVRKGFLELAQEDTSGRWKVLDARLSSPELARIIWKDFQSLLYTYI